MNDQMSESSKESNPANSYVKSNAEDKPPSKTKAKNEKEQLDADFNLRFSKKMLVKYKEEAKYLKVPLAKYFRNRIERKPIIVYKMDSGLSNLHYDLNKIGVNLNQIAKKLNQKKQENIELELINSLNYLVIQLTSNVERINKIIDSQENKSDLEDPNN